jgi:hypothetical protein
MEFKSAQPNKFGMDIASVLFILSRLKIMRPFRKLFQRVGEIASFTAWQDRLFGKRVPFYWSRESLWRICFLEANSLNRPINIFEFGVAYGYTPNYLIKNLNNFNYTGFDTFEGLPRGWRDEKKGAFSTSGIPPKINDSRVNWVIGDVNKTIQKIPLKNRNEVNLFILDLDLYEPTLAVLQSLVPKVKPGDYFYFDEALDNDERSIIEHWFFPKNKFQIIGTTNMALLFKVI